MGRTTSLNQPAAMRNMPAPPPGLSLAGRDLWNRTLAAKPAAEWSPADCTLLALYVRCALDVQRLDIEIAEAGETTPGRNGTPAVSPLVQVRARREATLLTTAKRLRLTPCSRYTAKDVGRLHKHATKAGTAAETLESDALLAGGPMQ